MRLLLVLFLLSLPFGLTGCWDSEPTSDEIVDPPMSEESITPDDQTGDAGGVESSEDESI